MLHLSYKLGRTELLETFEITDPDSTESIETKPFAQLQQKDQLQSLLDHQKKLLDQEHFSGDLNKESKNQYFLNVLEGL